ncbi:MAG: NAD-dependent epimerase/dehydratase family protein, partial [Candidatus Kariarchaeaceae archaeon]
MKHAFITGISGFVGKALALQLHKSDYEIAGLDRSRRPETLPND